MTKTNAVKIAQYCEKNPVKQYADYRDELPENMIEALLEGNKDKFWELAWNYELQMQDNSYQYDFEELYKSAKEELGFADTEKNKDFVRENMCYDYSEYWKDCAGNSSCNIAVTLLDADGNEIYAPHSDNSEEENARLSRYLIDTFGLTQDQCDKIECVYSSEILKVTGTIDFAKLLEPNAKIASKIKLSPNDAANMLFHESMNGSGNLGNFPIKNEVTLDCIVRNDSINKYGIQAVYGFVSSYWEHELDLIEIQESNNIADKVA